MALTPEALAALMEQNTVEIANSEPPDAFKVRCARIEIVNSAEVKLVTDTDPGAYTSVGWEFAEGKVGSPLRIMLTFRRPQADTTSPQAPM